VLSFYIAKGKDSYTAFYGCCRVYATQSVPDQITVTGNGSGSCCVVDVTSPLRVLTLDRKVGPILGERYRLISSTMLRAWEFQGDVPAVCALYHPNLDVLCFSDDGPDTSPHPISQEELRAAFNASDGMEW